MTWVDGDCHGRPVVEAARLESVASAEQVLCSDTVRLLAGGRGGHEFEGVGPLELKGLPGAVDVCSVVWQVDEPDRGLVPLPAALSASPNAPQFVGRLGPLRVLRKAYEEAATGRRVQVALGGEPGIGKSRLVSEFAVEVHRRGAIVLRGGNDPDLHLPFETLVEAVDHLIAEGGREAVEAWLPVTEGVLEPLLTGLSAGPSPESGLDPESGRARIVEGLDRLFARVSESGPVVLIAEDLQWAPESTLIALRRLVPGGHPPARG